MKTFLARLQADSQSTKKALQQFTKSKDSLFEGQYLTLPHKLFPEGIQAIIKKITKTQVFLEAFSRKAPNTAVHTALEDLGFNIKFTTWKDSTGKKRSGVVVLL